MVEGQRGRRVGELEEDQGSEGKWRRKEGGEEEEEFPDFFFYKLTIALSCLNAGASVCVIVLWSFCIVSDGAISQAVTHLLTLLACQH